MQNIWNYYDTKYYKDFTCNALIYLFKYQKFIKRIKGVCI